MEPVAIYADPDMWQSIFRNLISYAVKFSESAGKINIKQNPQEDGEAIINRAGQGGGMDPEKAQEPQPERGEKPARTSG